MTTQTTTTIDVAAIRQGGRLNDAALAEQETVITRLAGPFMGRDKKRGRVYTWVPLHLGDAANACSPRTFLSAWRSAADHSPPPSGLVVDHHGLIDGVRHASRARMEELREDFPWIDLALAPLQRQFVPIPRDELFALWETHDVITKIREGARTESWLAPIDVFIRPDPASLLRTMTRIGVMEERANGKINVPDIFRVGANILRKGGVAVPRRQQ